MVRAIWGMYWLTFFYSHPYWGIYWEDEKQQSFHHLGLHSIPPLHFWERYSYVT